LKKEIQKKVKIKAMEKKLKGISYFKKKRST